MIKKYQLSDSQCAKLKQYLSKRKAGEKIFPSTLKACLSIDIDTAYEILEDFKAKGDLKLCFWMKCQNCHKEFFFERLNEFECECKCCGYSATFKDIIVLYEVIR